MKLEKITKEVSGSAGASRRWYDDACGTAHALELVGERWSLMILREMMFGPRRFGDIRAALPGISANVLTQRLETLERHGIVERSKLPPPASVQVYGLTEWGYEADQLLMVLGGWAARSPDHDPTLPLSKTSLMLSFRTMFQADVAGEAAMTVGFQLGEESFRVRIAGGVLTPVRGEIDDADVTFVTTPEAMAGYVYGKVPLEALEAGGAIRIAGDRALAEAFQTFFTLPPKAGC
ncbi:winged helix-turn-helix transcriptional regulator [uncultured Brevundimonas sp.]|uniref:winged helix-turn-helix transcriptional regulator n=1 Tax=uncultured Brevundimonas sp. TaxID=213418 RepID=UPI0030EDE519